MTTHRTAARRALYALGVCVAATAASLFLCAPSFAAQLPSAPLTVMPGETAASVAALAGFGLRDFLRVNHLTAGSSLSPGTKVALPFLYKVVAGDEVGYVARQYDTTVASLRHLNSLDSDRLTPGQVLLIARGSASAGTRRAASATMARTLPTADVTQTLTMVATSYDASRTDNGPWGAVDYFGNPLHFGDVAVDPAIIPLGTKLFISGYHDSHLPRGGFYAIADDEGGAISGDRIDIFIRNRQQAWAFGIQSVTVKVIG
ncbi:MAG: 3D domain-containing protein [Firmicutes bacterium]|nr:3D domain-containing protein [Bacillota bacterium]